MQVNEGLKAGDLDGVVSNRFSVDQYKSKMGEDKNIMVLAFTVDSLAPAKDLERFAETGYSDVLDADATPGTMEDGKHKVFIEFARKEGVIANTAVSSGTLSEMVPTNPEAYEQKVNELKIGEARNFFDKFEMLECKINDDIISFEKPGIHNPINFHMHQFGNTQQIMKEAKAFAIDQGSIAECLYLTKYFGMNNITKTTENKFIFSKGNQSAVLSKYRW